MFSALILESPRELVKNEPFSLWSGQIVVVVAGISILKGLPGAHRLF